MTPKQRIRLQTNLYRDNIDSSTELKKRRFRKRIEQEQEKKQEQK